ALADFSNAPQFCPPTARFMSGDNGCYLVFATAEAEPGHLLVDSNGNVWWGGYWIANSLDRLNPYTGTITQFPLNQPALGRWPFGAWELMWLPSGKIAFVTQWTWSAGTQPI